MGMDVYANNPDSPMPYFRASVWSWRPLHDFMSIAAKHVYGEDLDERMAYNDGAGIPAELCEQVADLMQEEFNQIEWDSDNTLRYDIDADDKTKSWYGVNKEHLQEWISFVRTSGGFSVC